MRVRTLTAADVPFMERMMLLAGFPPDRELPHGASGMPHVRRFLDAWGRSGDVGTLALDAGDSWAVAGSNRGPPACKAGALTS